MASNDPEDYEAPPEGPVALLIRTVHAPAQPNAQNAVRVIALVVALATMTTAPQPFLVIGALALIILALSLGVSESKRRTLQSVQPERTPAK
jgi:hypothetical protein